MADGVAFVETDRGKVVALEAQVADLEQRLHEYNEERVARFMGHLDHSRKEFSLMEWILLSLTDVGDIDDMLEELTEDMEGICQRPLYLLLSLLEQRLRAVRDELEEGE